MLCLIYFRQNLDSYVFCYKCNKVYNGDDIKTTIESHPEHNEQAGFDFPGVFVLPDFISPVEENALMVGIDGLPWDISQSGRRKQVSADIENVFPAKKITNQHKKCMRQYLPSLF